LNSNAAINPTIFAAPSPDSRTTRSIGTGSAPTNSTIFRSSALNPASVSDESAVDARFSGTETAEPPSNFLDLSVFTGVAPFVESRRARLTRLAWIAFAVLV
jgi:hypothetical protein